MQFNLLYIFIILLILCINTYFCSNISKVTDAQMKKMGWTNYNLTDLNFCINKFEINTKERLWHFISALSYESALGKYTEDIRNCTIYEGRRDLGNIQPGDGCKYKGVGYLKLSGRYLYQQFSNAMGDEDIMKGFSYVSSKYLFSICGFLWNKYNISALVDSTASIGGICRKFLADNGVVCDKETRKYYNKAKDIF